MAFDQTTLDDIRALAPDGALMLRPTGATFSAEWQRPDGTPSHTAPGDSEGEALDNLLLNLQGKLDRAIKLRAAQAREADAQAALDAAKAEREAIEAEKGAILHRS